MWQVFSAAGGGLAFTFIVCVAVAVFALGVLYIASAMVVLERFARVARRRATVASFYLAFSLATGLLLRASQSPDARILPEGAAELPAAIAIGGFVVASAMGVCWLAITRIDATKRGTGVLVVLGLALALWLGATGQVLVALAPSLAFGTLAILMLALRRRSGSELPGRAEEQLRWVVVSLVVGAGIALALARPAPELAAFGEAIFSGFVALVMVGLVPLAGAGLVEARRSAEWFIAVRYLVAKRRQVFISAITGICVIGIAAGVWLIIIVLSVMNGFEGTWRDEILGNRSHFTIHSSDGDMPDYARLLERVRAVDGVVAAAPYVDAQGMVRGSGGEIFGVQLRGIDPDVIGRVTDLPNDLIFGSLEALGDETQEGDGLPPIVVGNQLAATLGTVVGDPVLLISPFGGAPTPLGPAPRLERFQIVGIYRTSFFQYDAVYTYTSIPAAQAFRRVGNVIDGIEARTTDFYRSKLVGDRVAATLGAPFFARDWKEFFPAFFQALKTERVMMFVLLSMIVVVAAFLIVATLVMMIMEKSSDIAILKAMGAEDQSIERIFAIEGTLIGLVGTMIGVISGIAVTGQLGWIQERLEMVTGVDTLPASVYQLSTLPSEVDLVQVAVVSVIALIFSLGATVLPSRQGARLDPAEGLRYE